MKWKVRWVQSALSPVGSSFIPWNYISPGGDPKDIPDLTYEQLVEKLITIQVMRYLWPSVTKRVTRAIWKTSST